MPICKTITSLCLFTKKFKEICMIEVLKTSNFKYLCVYNIYIFFIYKIYFILSVILHFFKECDECI